MDKTKIEKANKLFRDLIAYRTYCKFINHLGRKESLEETITRNMTMMLDKFPKLSSDIVKAYKYVYDFQLMPSMRSLQFAGLPILKNNARLYNCSYVPINDVKCFSEVLFLLLSGTGVGFSVQRHHVNQLPVVKIPREENIYIVHDSIEGWAEALNALMEAYFFNKIKPVFDFSKIRPKGALLSTTGAKAPGSKPLENALNLIEQKLRQAAYRKLKPIEVHDIICIASECVLAGGIRRSALISLFDRDDLEMLKAKSGEWWVNHPYRARANNSAVLPRSEVTKEEFNYIFDICQKSGSGEPGFSWSNDLDMGFNPCHEISLSPYQFCNLVTINAGSIKNEKDFYNKVYSASLIATLQASFTDFHYLRPVWKETTEREALIGVSMSGICDNYSIFNEELLKKGAELVKFVNEKYAKKININIAARTTTIKPEGTTSCIFGSSSGIHARHSRYYLRRIRINKGDELDVYLRSVIPNLVEDDLFDPNSSVVVIPQVSPENSITRENESALSLLNRAYFFNKHWVHNGHRSGNNMNNVSCTVSVKDNEWIDVRESMWENRDLYSGISLLPYDGGTYKQAPFEETDVETIKKYLDLIEDVNLTEIKNIKDMTNNFGETIACGGGLCELT